MPVTETAPAIKPPIASAGEIGRRIERLSSDEFEGRAPGTKGGQMASQYIADEMKAAGLIPMGENGTYFQQKTNAVYWTKRLDETVSIDDSELVYVGYGVVAPEYGRNDYAGVDVKGKTVVMLVNDPGFATGDDDYFKGKSMTYYGRWTYKFEEAGRQGAAAAIIIHQTEPASYGWDVVTGSWTGAQYDLVRPDGGASRTQLEGWVHVDTARELFKASGKDMDEVISASATKNFKPFAMTGLTLDASINQSVNTTVSRNVAGGVRGTKRPDEYVLYMAHWDHLGKNEDAEGDDKIWNGAVDNATGTAAIIEIGEAFVQQGAPERSAIFVAVTAEESGLFRILLSLRPY